MKNCNCNCNMKKNMGLADRIIRTTAAIVFIELVTCKKVPASVRGSLMVVSGLFLATSMVGSCPAYTVLGISTKSNEEANDGEMPNRVF